MSDAELERRRALRFGWTSLLAWAAFGLALEGAHGFKLSTYLDDELGRMLLRLAHAHGVGLAIVLLVFASAGVPLFADRPGAGRGVGRLLRTAAVLLPLGFAISAINHPESDPGPAIILVPIGAAALIGGLVALAIAAWRTR